ncbi:MAG: ACP S-malonyltransferase [Syntrophomonadaceae bacterium]|jgi:[acyl-carrier-protein] S-malonyltransferase
MARVGFVFPGQGAQQVGMGKDLCEHFEVARIIFQQAEEMAGYDIKSLCFEGPAEQLNQTEFAQPALLVSSVATGEVLKEQGIQAVMMAGLSLGEYSALVSAGALSLQQAVPLVQQRARLMQAAVPIGQGAMAAVLGLDADVIQSACEQDEGIVSIANYNCPRQYVISGASEAVHRVSAALKESGARVMPLAVSVPSHSRLMAEAAQKLRPYLEALTWSEPLVPVVSNVNAVKNQTSQLAELLVQQLYSPVRWEQSVRHMMTEVDYFIEVGPGSILSGLIKKIDKNRVLGQVNDVRSLEKVVEKVNVI